MIQLESIEIEEFRGIKKLQLALGKDNFGICGPNGTGKSGIVDAIEFALTGDITRLGGSGTGELSVKAHAPHVDARKSPQKSAVKIVGYIPNLKKSVTIERRVISASSPAITPNDLETRDVLEKLSTHPEFALSRREIVKYILTPAGQRSKDVQLLLRLDQIEKVRQSLQRISNDAKKEAQLTAADDVQAKKDLLQHLGLKTLSKPELLTAINERRKLLRLELLDDIASDTLLKQGVAAKGDQAKPTSRIAKATALADVETLLQYITNANSAELSKVRAATLNILEGLQTDSEALQSFRRQVLYEQGLELLDEDACPLCDKEWELAALRTHLEQKIAKATDTAKLVKQLQEALQPILNNLDELTHSASRIAVLGGSLDPKIGTELITGFSKACEDARDTLEQVCVDPTAIKPAIAVLSGTVWKPTAETNAAIEIVKKRTVALPDPSKEEEARDYLVIAQERYDRCRATKRKMEEATKRRDLAAKVLDIYGTTSNGVLEGIYDAVQKDFTDFYRFINRDDEGTFDGKLTPIPSPAKLALDVDFYGRGKFPPGAYHSEGHQDAMGLCLYLALMKHTLGHDFTFAVLDDVLMSVDAGHRREVCALLKTKFPKTQFVLTTHDPVWLQFMRTEKLIQSSVSFGGWTVDTGPQVWNEGDVWQQIADKLAKDDVPGAAGTLRRYLEYVGTVLADNLRAPVEYHGNGQYDLGDLMPSVTRTWKSLTNAARDSAKSWGQNIKTFEALATEAKDKVAKTCAEQWMINKAVHYNGWASLQKKEFAIVASAFQDLLRSMQCSNVKCGEFVWVSPAKGDREALRCSCGAINYNLRMK